MLNKSYNNALHLTSQHAVSLRYTLCRPSGELKRLAMIIMSRAFLENQAGE